MNKRFAIEALTLSAVIALGTSGCALAETPDSTATPAPDVRIQADENETIQWPSAYLITYEVEQAGGTVIEVTQGRDAEGNVYFKTLDQELLFIAEGEHYRLYQATRSGELEALPEMYSEHYVQ